MEKETVEQFLSRGGRIQKLSPKGINEPFKGKRQMICLDYSVLRSLGDGNYKKRKLPTSDWQ